VPIGLTKCHDRERIKLAGHGAVEFQRKIRNTGVVFLRFERIHDYVMMIDNDIESNDGA